MYSPLYLLLVLAKERGAYVAALEHRYYGQSHPFDKLTTENLQYLSSKQALADLASFIEFLKEKNKNLNLYKVIIVGGSYSGCLSAWFRQMYPHLVLGSISSSCPVLAKKDFFEYDQAISAAVPSDCRQNIQEAMQEAEAAADADYESLRNKLACDKIDGSTDFLAGLGDMVAHAIQYNMDTGTPEEQTKKLLCDTMTAELSENVTRLDQLFRFFRTMARNMNTSCNEWASLEPIYNETVDYNDASRAWTYQTCTEFGYFQTAPARAPLRSPRINTDYYDAICKKAFGDTIHLDIDGTNDFYHARDSYATRVAFVNGMMDPWSRLGITSKTLTRLFLFLFLFFLVCLFYFFVFFYSVDWL